MVHHPLIHFLGYKIHHDSVFKPVPAGINLPSKTFSFRPSNLSTLPRIDASVKILVVSWNDAADKKESVSSDAFVIPKSIGRPVAGFLPLMIISLFPSVNSRKLTRLPGKK